MTRKELLQCIKETREAISQEPPGSSRIGELTIALVCLYEELDKERDRRAVA